MGSPAGAAAPPRRLSSVGRARQRLRVAQRAASRFSVQRWVQVRIRPGGTGITQYRYRCAPACASPQHCRHHSCRRVRSPSASRAISSFIQRLRLRVQRPRQQPGRVCAVARRQTTGWIAAGQGRSAAGADRQRNDGPRHVNAPPGARAATGVSAGSGSRRRWRTCRRVRAAYRLSTRPPRWRPAAAPTAAPSAGQRRVVGDKVGSRSAPPCNR